MTEAIESVKNNSCPVSSFNEWDPLEEIIVGRLEGATIPYNHVTVTYTIPAKAARLYRLFAGRHYPEFLVKQAQRELCATLDVRRKGELQSYF